MKYYEIIPTDEPCWLFDIAEKRFHDESSQDPMMYGDCRRILNPEPVRVEVEMHGQPLDFLLPFLGLWVVPRHMGEIITSVAPNDVQRIPVVADDLPPGQWEALNHLGLVDCLDHEKSDIRSYYPDPYPESPWKAGHPHVVYKIIIDPERAKGRHLFRIKGHWMAEIISEKMKDAFESAGLTGMEFLPVTE